MNISKRMKHILRQYRKKPGCDPDMSEYVKLCHDMTKYLISEAPDYGIYSPMASERYPIPLENYKMFQQISDQFKQKLLENDLGITDESPLYLLFKEITSCVATYSVTGDIELTQKLGDVSLSIAKNKRDVEKGLKPYLSITPHEFENLKYFNENLSNPQVVCYNTRKLLLDEIGAEVEKEHGNTQKRKSKSLFR